MQKLLLFCLLLPGLPAAAQAVDPTFTSPTSLYEPGAVWALGPAQADGGRLVAGTFTRMSGTATGQLVRLAAAGTLDQAFLQNVGPASNVYNIKAGLNGQYLLGSMGGALNAGGLSRTELLRLNADGTGDASFDAGTGPSAGSNNADYGYSIDYAVQPDGKVLVGGYFDSFSGAPAVGLVRLNVNCSLDTGFSVGSGLNNLATNYEDVEALAVQPSGKILVGGTFSAFNGQAAPGLVRLNANGSLDPTLPAVLQAGSIVTSLVQQPDGKTLVTGYLTANGSYAQLIRLLPSGALDPSFNIPSGFISSLPYAYGQPIAALQPDGKIVLVGYFSAAGSPTSGGVARLNADGSPDYSFSLLNGTTFSPSAVGVQPNGAILAGANNTQVIFARSQETTLAQYTSTGNLDATYAPKPQVAAAVATVTRLADGTFLAGGSFTEWNGQPVHRVVHLSATGTLDAAFSNQTGALPSGVSALLQQPDGRLLVASGRGVLRLLASGSPVPSLNSEYSLPITHLALQPDGRMLAGGPFAITLLNGTTLRSLVRLTASGSLDPSFARGASPFGAATTGIQALLLQPDGRVVMGSTYIPTGGGPATSYVVRYESTGALDATFTPQSFTGATATTPGIRTYALARQPDGKLLVGGNFTQVGGTARAGVARLNSTGALDATFVPSSQLFGTIYSLAVQPNGRVLLGGLFTPAGSSVGANLTRVLANGQPDASFAPMATPSSLVSSLLVQPDGAIVLAGSFQYVNNLPQLALARITAPNVLAVAAPAATAARTSAWPVPAREVLHVAPDPSAQPRRAELLDALGRPVVQQVLSSTAGFTLPTAGLPAGLYLLRVTYATGAVTRQIVVE